MVVFVVVSPVSLFTALFPFYMYFVMVVAAVLAIVLAIAWQRGRNFAPAISIGLSIVVIGTVIDMLNINDSIHTAAISDYAMFFFLVQYSFIYAVRSNQEQERMIRHSSEVAKMNLDLEKRLVVKESELNECDSRVGKLRGELVEKNEELKHENDLKNRFITILGHDIKGPVAYSQQMIDMLMSEKVSGKERDEMIRLLASSSRSTLNLLENLVYWGRSQSGALKAMAVQFPLGKVVNETIELYDLALRDKKIKLTANISDDIKVYADKEQVKLILRNLISNAVKFTMENGKVNLRAKNNDEKNEMTFEIEDTGLGIGKERLKILQSGEAVQSTDGTRNEQGTGIGLRLCRELVDLNKGKLDIQSELGKGSVFIMVLPILPPH